MINSSHGFLLSNIPITSANSISTPCDDNFVGVIEYDGTDFKGYNGTNQFGLQRNAGCSHNKCYQRVKVDYNAFKPISDKRKIVILLESPHINEYKPTPQIGLHTAPALGNSGNKFNAQCITVFNNNIGALSFALNLIGQEIFDIYFVNAIQYQCSLGLHPIKSKLRDFVFEALWNRQPNSFKDDLIERLNFIQPDLIINACTRELQKTCCNGNNIMSDLKGFNCAFLTASNHILYWNPKTIIL